MKSSEYKTQFLQFVAAAYPNGLPEGSQPKIMLGLLLSDGTVSHFEFHFEAEDYENFLTGKRPRVKKESFYDKLTPNDTKFLQDIRISSSDVKKTRR